MSYRFAVIGGGLTATSLVCQLVDTVEALPGDVRSRVSGLSVDLFEKQDVVGPGTAHSARFVLPVHITNMCARDMSVRTERPDEFQTWVDETGAALPADTGGSARGEVMGASVDERCNHYPRALMGEYLASQMERAFRTARRIGLKLRLHCGCEVVDLDDIEGRIHLKIAGSPGTGECSGPYDGALIATGHWSAPRVNERFIPSPWPAAVLRAAIPPGARVGVLGSSLSAIEVALTLTSDGRFSRGAGGNLVYLPSENPIRLTLCSRRGLLPRVRGRIGSRPNRWFTVARLQEAIAACPYRLRLSTIFELLDRELRHAYGRRIDWHRLIKPARGAAALLADDLERALTGDGPDGELIWQTVLVQIFPLARELYLHLEPGERERFDREFNTCFFLHAATQPAANGEKLLALMKAGVVEVVRLGNDYRLDAGDGTGDVEMMYRAPGGAFCRETFSHCVDARGQTRSVEVDPSPLIRNLLRKGIVEVERRRRAQPGRTGMKHDIVTGSILIDPGTHRVVQAARAAAGDPSRSVGGIDLFAVGAMTRGQIIDASMASGIARSTRVIADLLIAGLGAQEGLTRGKK